MFPVMRWFIGAKPLFVLNCSSGFVCRSRTNSIYWRYPPVYCMYLIVPQEAAHRWSPARRFERRQLGIARQSHLKARYNLVGSITSAPSSLSTTNMKRFLKIKRKKSPKPPQRPISPEEPAEPPGFRPELGAGPPAEFPDLTVKMDQPGGSGPQIASPVRKDEEQEHPALEASTSGIVLDGTSHKDEPAGECS